MSDTLAAIFEEERNRLDEEADDLRSRLLVNTPPSPGAGPEDAARIQQANRVGGGFYSERAMADAAIRSYQNDRALEVSPRLRTWLNSNASNAAVAADDLPAMSIWDRMLDIAAWANGAPGRTAEEFRHTELNRAWRQGQRNIEAARLANRGNPRTLRHPENTQTLTSRERKRLQELEEIEREEFGTLGTVVEQLPQIFGSFEAGGRRAVRDAQASWRQSMRDIEEFSPIGAVEAAANAPFAALTAGASGGVRGVTGFTYEQEAGAAFQEFARMADVNGNRIDPNIAGLYARRVGEINAGIEFLGLGTAAKAVGATEVFGLLTSRAVRDALRRRGFREAATRLAGGVAGAALTEGATEMTQEGVTIALGELARQQAGGEWENLQPDEIADRLWESFRVGATVGGVLGSVPSVARFGADLDDVRAVREQQELFAAIAEGAEASKLRQRMPGRYAEAVNAMTANGPLAEVRIDAERFAAFFQDRNDDAYAAMDRIEGSGGREALQEALDAGGEISIPMGSYAAQIIGTPAHEALAPHIRMGAGQMTPAEVAARLELGVDLERATAEATKLQAQAAEQLNEVAGVERRIKSMFDSADAFVPSANKRFVQLFTAAISTLATRAGITPTALLDRIGLNVSMDPNDLAGDVRPSVLEQRGRSPWRGDQRFSDARLNNQQNQAVELALNNYPNPEIAERMGIDVKHVGSLLSQARKKGFVVERGAPEIKDGPSEYAIGAMTRLLEAAEKFSASSPNGQMPSGYAERLSKETGYSPSSVEQLLNQLRAGVFGDDLMIRALRIPTARRGPQAFMKPLIGTLMDKGLTAEQITARVNVVRESMNLAPATKGNVSVQMTQIRQMRRRGEHLYQFGGEHAAGHDMSGVFRAEEMELEGADEVAIWRETGWWRNPADGKWRFEIDDTNAVFKVGAIGDIQGETGFEGRLGDLIDFPELFAEYPALADVTVTLAIDPTAEPEGSYGPPESDVTADWGMGIVAPDETFALTTLLHEIQHAIQGIEGFAAGGTFDSGVMDERISADMDKWREHFWLKIDPELVAKGMTRDDVAETAPETYVRLEAWVEEQASIAVYLRLAGEMEARAVENRRGEGAPKGGPGNRKLSPDVREQTPPSASYDLPLNEAIVPLEEGEHVVALKSIAGNALGAPPDNGGRGRRAAGGAASRRPGDGASGLRGILAGLGSEAERNRAASGADNPAVIEQAQAEGYQGSDTGEAQEWLSAVRKGLPMDEASRMGRMREQGFEGPFFHGTNREVSGGMRRSWSGALGPGVYVARDPKTTEIFAGTLRGVDRDGQLNVEFGTGSNQIPLMVRGGRFATRSQLEAATMRAEQSLGRYASRTGAQQMAADELVSQGYVGAADLSRDFYVVFDPKNLRSRFAAFDPSRSGESDLLAQRAFHGSPYDFDRFSTSHMGTGEGAQSYGYGLYFAESEAVGKVYRDRLSAMDYSIDGQPAKYTNPLHMAAIEKRRRPFHEDARWYLEEQAKQTRETRERKLYREAAQILKRGDPLPEITAKSSGRLYEVELPDGPYIDYDKALSDQPDILRMMREGGLDVRPGEEGLRAEMWINGLNEEGARKFRAAGIVGVRFLDAVSRQQGHGTSNFVIFDEKDVQVVAKDGKPVDASERADIIAQHDLAQRPSNRGPSGAIYMPHLVKGGELREAIIKLFSARDLSTPLHEGGHLFLEILQTLATDEGAAPQLAADWQTTLDWFGVTNEQWQSFNLEQKRQYHEQFARGFEAYLMEGKAPSMALQDMFAAFKRWLVAIYRSILALNVELSDDVRGVMDRLLATDDAITEARNAQGAQAVLTREQFGGTDRQYASYLKHIDRAREDALASVQKEAMDALYADRTAWWKSEEKKVRRAVEIDIDSEPARRAADWLGRGEWRHGEPPEGLSPIRLSRHTIEGYYGREMVDALPSNITKPSKARKDVDAVDPDLAASLLGFDSGQQMLEAIRDLTPRKEAIDAETRRRMEHKFGDPFADGSVQDEADRAAHRESQARVIEMELDAMARATGAASRPVNRAAKDIAQRQISHMSVRQIRNHQWFLGNERRHARAALEAMEQGRPDAAQKSKHQQLVNFHLYALARKASDEMDVAVRYFRRLTESQGTRDNIDRDYLDQIDGLLEGYELKPISKREEWRRVSLMDWVERMKQLGREEEISVDPRTLREASRRPFSQLPLDEARGLVDTIKNIEHLGRTKDDLIERKRKREFRAAITDMVTAMRTTGPISPEVRRNYSPNAVQRVQDWALKWNASLTRLERLFVYLDGEPQGPLTQNLWNVLEDGEIVYAQHMRPAVEQMNLVWAGYTKDERARMFTQRIPVPELNHNFTKQELLMIALNWGTEDNRAAVVNGYPGWTEAGVQRALDRLLSERDWATVQAIWACVGTLREPAFALHEEVTGVRPVAVEGVPVRTPFGAIQGQYFPLKYDGERDERVAREDEARSVQEIYASQSIRAMTQQGHFERRSGSGGRPVKLNMSVFTEHMKSVITDIAYRRAVISIGRIIRDPEFTEAFKEVGGQALYRELMPWLKEKVNPQVDPQVPLVGDLGKLRGNIAIAVMGWRFGVAMQQHTGYINAAVHLGGPEVMATLLKVYGRPDKLYSLAMLIQSKSAYMTERQRSWDRDVREAIDKMESTDRLYPIKEHAFAVISAMDWAVSGVTWLAAYDKARAGNVAGVNPMEEAEAVAYADQAVRATQGAGRVQDLPRIMRSGPMLKLFTMFYNYSNMIYNWLVYDQVLPLMKGRVPPHVFAGNLFLIFFVAPILAEILAGRGDPSDDETEEDRNNRLLKVAMKSPFSTVAGLRDFIGPIGTTYDYQMSPVGGALNTFADVANRAASGSLDSEYGRKQAAMAAGYAFGLPSAQAYSMIENMQRQLEEEDGFDPYAFAVGDAR